MYLCNLYNTHPYTLLYTHRYMMKSKYQYIPICIHRYMRKNNFLYNRQYKFACNLLNNYLHILPYMHYNFL